jgi:hypothetical protein
MRGIGLAVEIRYCPRTCRPLDISRKACADWIKEAEGLGTSEPLPKERRRLHYPRPMSSKAESEILLPRPPDVGPKSSLRHLTVP